MFDITIHDVFFRFAHLGTAFQIAICALVILLVVVLIALPLCLTLLATRQYFLEQRARHGNWRWLLDINVWIGRPVAWLIVLVMLIQMTVIALRHVYDTGSIQLQESIWYLHGTLLMLGAGYTFTRKKHVRLDVWYRYLSPSAQCRVDLVGHLLLLIPFSVTLLWVSTQYIARSFAVRESSAAVGGLPLLFIMKSLIAVFGMLLLLYSIRNSRVLIRKLQFVNRELSE